MRITRCTLTICPSVRRSLIFSGRHRGVANAPNPAGGGVTSGGAQVTFSNGLLCSSQLAQEIASDERAHVVLLRNALGGAAIAKPNINLNALGFGFGNQNDFIKLARIFEGIGVSA